MSRHGRCPWSLTAVLAISCQGAGIGIVLVATSSPAWANGAFPDSEKLLLPADRPEEIVLGTNFGLVLSEDAGVTWTWTCEQTASSGASFYADSASPADRIFAVGPGGLGRSDDGGCSWHIQTLDPAQDGVVVDAFPDPTDARRIYEIISVSGSRTVPDRVFLSEDGGETLGKLVFSAPLGATLTSVESARSDPRTIYLAFASLTPEADYPLINPVLARSTDGGLGWVTHDATSSYSPCPDPGRTRLPPRGR
jgi:hypothetical protein